MSRVRNPKKASWTIAAALPLLLAGSPAAPAGFSVAWAPDTNLERLDVDMIAHARTSIDFAAYVLTDVAVVDALTAAAHRGVRVRIYRDGGQREVGAYVASTLTRLVAAPGVEVRTKSGNTLMHLKSFCIDGRLLRGGAANFSASGLKHQDNDRWETDDPATVKAFAALFERLWGRR